jgi:hypothetical protein
MLFLKNISIAILVFIFFYFPASGQINVKDSIVSAPLLTVSYSYQFPFADMKKRFSNNSNIGGSFLYKTNQNWLWGVDGYFLFRDTVKENGILDHISTEKGFVIGRNGEYAEIHLYERGFSASLSLGKLFPAFGPNANSGIVALASIGLLQHKIRIEDIGNFAPQLGKEYKKGYDRLSNGLAFTQFVGYIYLSNRRLINFFGGISFMEAWTKSRRTINFDTMQYDPTKRFDCLIGLRMGWIIPLYKKVPKDYYYY